MIKQKRIEIAFVGKTAFPVSTASSNRILSLSKGLVMAGAHVEVYCFGVTKFSEREKPISKTGMIDSISWNYTSLRVKSSKFRLINGFLLLIGQFFGYIKLLIKYYNKQANFFTSQTSFAYIFPLWILSKICGGKVLFFRSELPKPILLKSPLTFIYENLVYPITFRFFDGLFIMTTNLSDYFNRWKNSNAISVIIPNAVILENFARKNSRVYDFEYIAYCGSLSILKDGIDILIKAYASIQKYFPEIYLLIIGRVNSLKELELLQAIVNQHVSSPNKVVFTGQIDRTKVPYYLKNAKILALARPSSIQAEGGFPSKIGEYLATGNPVVVTDTGEIRKYLSDLDNARIAIPNDVADFTEKLLWVLSNPEEAKRIGANGRQTALQHFDHLEIGKKILSVLQRHLK